ncbi:MAG: carbohydrate binding family 9 domain-containing protein [Thermodesulfobacteriota bacterium]
MEMEPEIDAGISAESVPESVEMKVETITITAVSGKPVIDGHVDEKFWDQARSFDIGIELFPERLKPAGVKTEALVAATKTHLYVAFIAHDPNPEKIRSALRERDATKYDDYVSIIIDPSGAMARKFEFRVNPDGTLSDLIQDTISDRYIYDWDAEWTGKAQRTDFGYTVEMAIPASSLHVPDRDLDKNSRGLVILKRCYPRNLFQLLGTFFFFKRPIEGVDNVAGILSSLETEEQDGEKDNFLPDKLSVTPHYIYYFNEERGIGGHFEQVKDQDENSLGFDAEYQFSTSTSLSATINPNYTDVEADIARQSINNPFSVFQPEKRQFFRSVTEYYSSLIPVVYTRNIVNPRLGLSFVADSGVNAFSAFASDDRQTQVIIPDNLGSDTTELLDSSYSGAFRYRQTHANRASDITGTLRVNDIYHNATLNYSGLLNFGPDDAFRYHLSYSDSKYPKKFAEDMCGEAGCVDEIPEDPCPLGDCSVNAQVLRVDYGDRFDGHAVQARYKHDGPKSLYWLGYEQSSPGYRADLGYLKGIDKRALYYAYGKKWYLKTPLDDGQGNSRIRSYILGKYMRSYEYDDLLENSVSAWLEFRGTYQSIFRVGYRYQERAVNRVDQATLDTGDNAPLFDERYVQWFFETSPRRDWKFHFDGRLGDVADATNMVLGYMVELKPRLIYRVGPLELTAGGEFRDYLLDDETLYTEQFLSFSVLFKNSQRFSHRFLYLDNLTKRDSGRWISDELERELERVFEYTLICEPVESWKVLFGFKGGYDHESDIDEGDFTDRELYFKIEKSL